MFGRKCFLSVLVVFFVALILGAFVRGFARAMHISLTDVGTFFLVGAMLMGSVASVIAVTFLRSIWVKDEPTSHGS